MMLPTNLTQDVIFVDCFKTIIIRTKSHRAIFQIWAELVANQLHIPAAEFYQCYRRTNFQLTWQQFWRHLVLEAPLSAVLKRMYHRLVKKYPDLNLNTFVTTATQLYNQAEMTNQTVNQDLITYLSNQKALGKKIYLVSDFYCPATTLQLWLDNLGVANIFDELFSSCDFGADKASTKLYKILLKRLNLTGKAVIMLGDSSWSDVTMARLAGLHAKKIKYKRR